jgi:hypothetical protein
MTRHAHLICGLSLLLALAAAQGADATAVGPAPAVGPPPAVGPDPAVGPAPAVGPPPATSPAPAPTPGPPPAVGPAPAVGPPPVPGAPPKVDAITAPAAGALADNAAPQQAPAPAANPATTQQAVPPTLTNAATQPAPTGEVATTGEVAPAALADAATQPAPTGEVAAEDDPAPFSNVPDPAHAPLVDEGTAFHCILTIVNPYDRAVRIKLVDPSCSCATVKLDSEFILPGGNTAMTITVPTANRSGIQHIHVSLFVSDPLYAPLECDAWWNVHPAVAVDALPPGADPDKRPADPAWQDIYRLVSDERPDELHRLHKRILVSCPDDRIPAGGLKVTVDYPGTLWAFTTKTMSPSMVLIIAKAKDPEAKVAEGDLEEQVVVHTNQAMKPQFTLQFSTFLNKDSGRRDIAPGN